MQPNEIGDKPRFLQLRHVQLQYLRVIRHNGAVEVVNAKPLLHIIAHIRIENRIRLLRQQPFHVSVHQLRGVARGVGWDGLLPGGIELTRGVWGYQHTEPKLMEKRVPEWEKIIKI